MAMHNIGSFIRRCSSGRKPYPMSDAGGDAAFSAMVFTCHFEAGGPAQVEVIVQQFYVPTCGSMPQLANACIIR